MNSTKILDLRVANQHLSGTPFSSVYEAVSTLGAVQAQDYAAAKWGLGMRTGLTDEKIEEECNKGTILRTHVLRPTWHFVPTEDLLWMEELTAPRVRSFLAHYDRKLNITEDVRKHTQKIFVKALQRHTYLTREELAAELQSEHISAKGQLLAHIIIHSELDGILCSGPRKGKQFTYALCEQRINKSNKLSHEESLATLAQRYFTSHGPAQLKDFTWWSGLSTKDATEGIDSIYSLLIEEKIHEKSFWMIRDTTYIKNSVPSAFLLSIYDEFTIAYKDRQNISEERDIERMISMGNALTAVLIINGKAAGTWRRTITKSSVDIVISTFRKISREEKTAIEVTADKYRNFLGLQKLQLHISEKN